MKNNLDTHLENLFTFLRIPSIGTLPQHHGDMVKAGEFLKEQLREIGFQKVSLKHARGCEKDPPIVYAERIDNPKNPTILVYNHYDVQPVDPQDQWKHPPFEPVIENGNIYGRGTTDDKGQLMTHVAALSELSKEWQNTWPINIKIIYEGQEESSGRNLHAWLQEKVTQKLLQADIAVVSDSGFAAEGLPTIEYGLRGYTYFQVDITLSEFDLHSGQFGGSVLNPINALVHMLHQLYDVKTGKVKVPGFYDDVLVLDEEERKLLAKVPFNEKQHRKNAANAHALHGEKEYTYKERLCVRPTLDINGIWGGFSGHGEKTIIPANAHAKFSCRLVPNQDPKKIVKLIKKYLENVAPNAVHVKISHLSSGESILINRNTPWMKAAVEALEETFDHEVVFDRAGGSIPVVADFKTYLGLETLLFGYGLPDDNMHEPNEKMSLRQFTLGIECNKLFYKKCSKMTL